MNRTSKKRGDPSLHLQPFALTQTMQCIQLLLQLSILATQGTNALIYFCQLVCNLLNKMR